MTNLSPAAQAVMIAAFGKWMEIDDIDDDIPGKIAVAALRAAADQVVPEFWHEDNDIYGETMQDVRARLLTIATELEGSNG